jgi:HTH-type transcriptional regulator/antitoxin HipB
MDLGISQAELAERAGVSRKWIYEFEGGKPRAELGLLLRVLDALDLTLELSRAADGTPSELDALLDEHRAR